MSAEGKPLPAALEIFEGFDRAGVDYCHFKSNEHLLAGLVGDTDLDLLVDARHGREAQAVLQATGARRFASQGGAIYPAVEDYLAFDPPTGRMLHLHVHYALVAGEKHLKGYQLPFADALLATRVRDRATGVFTSEPNFEMLLLLVRLALKLRLRDRVAEALGTPYVRGGTLAEYDWLRQRLQPGELRRITEEVLGKEAGALVEALAETPPRTARLRELLRAARPALAAHRSYGALESRLLRVWRELTGLAGAVNRRLHLAPVPSRRTGPCGGRIIAFLGSDGSGKSTVLREIRGWLGWKLDIHPVYFGSGDGPGSWMRAPLQLALRVLSPLRQRLRRHPQQPAAGAGSGSTPRRVSWPKGVWAVVLAAEKRAKMRAAVKARNRGMFVICDRYPQAQVMGFNDGPLLSPWLDGDSALRRHLARWELDSYRALEQIAPDLVVKLDVTPEVACARKPEMAPDEVARRRAAVRGLDYGPHAEVLAIDATQPLERVLSEVKRAVWAQL